ncbi:MULTISPECIES: Tc toxin subunit A [unclassified Pseudomonas]|uniref:Tc toxin subunit A n=1 Tax=unclassified Pseudomonas TaxID=196821 RepID=UPI000A1EF182|nr:MULTISPECIES: Tc toxin subunit A [unclassified Pseudomonas]
MANTRLRPAEELYERLFATRTRRKKYPALHTYLTKGGSIFPLVENGIDGLVKDYRMSREDAQAFLRQASSMAIYIRRQFIEHTLTCTEQQKPGKALKKTASNAVNSLVDGPTFETLFKPNFIGSCPPNALESVWGPVAYLVELFQWISKRIEPVGEIATKYKLHERRSDLNELVVDANAVFQPVSAVEIINNALEAFIKKHGTLTDLVEALLTARYPNDLPWFQHWSTLDGVAEHLGMSVGNFAFTVDLLSPYFLQPKAWDANAGRALAHSSRLGPYQRTLLTETRVAHAARKAFFDENYGCEGVDGYKTLNEVPTFGEQTGLDPTGIEALLSIQASAPRRSVNVKFAEDPPEDLDSNRFGSAYINAGASPPVGITEGSDGLQKLTIKPESLATDTDFERFDRLNRKIRLDKWFGLRSFEVDSLLVAAIRAEEQGGLAPGKWWITDNVVHALGLFQLMRENYGCTAMDFAAFIHEMSVYGVGDELSLFDRVFNADGDYRQPLVLDGASFTAIPAVGSSDLTAIQLCNGLQIDRLTYGYLALAIVNAQGDDDNLKRTPAVVTAFYRLVKLARLLSITPIELVLMLTLLGGDDKWLNGLAGVPQIHGKPGEAPDVLHIIYAVHDCVRWCKDRQLPVLSMLQMVAQPQVSGVASETQLQLFDKVISLLPAARLTNAGFLAADVPSVPAGNWLDFLNSVADHSGLVRPLGGNEAEYLREARAKLNQAVLDGLPAMADEVRASIVEKMLGVLLQAREAQTSVVKEALAVFTGLDSERAMVVLAWANTTVYLLLREITAHAGTSAQNGRRTRVVDNPLLGRLANVQRLGEVVTQLRLSAAVVREYLDYGYRAWLGQLDKYQFSMRTLYDLTVFGRALEMSDQPEEKLLAYLRTVDQLPADIAGDSLWLAQEAGYILLAVFFQWSVAQVRECVHHIDPSDKKILKTLRQLDLLMRIRTLAEHSGMDAQTIFRLGKLPASIDKAAYATAAELALLSQSETRVLDRQPPGETEQLIVRTCTVDNSTVVANKPGAKAIYTVTLTDAGGSPLKGVQVFWQATLGTIETLKTDENGVLEAEFIPGKVLGSETPTYWLNLFQPLDALEIQVVPDPDTLFFPGPSASTLPLDSVPAGAEVQLFAELRDGYKNRGPNQLVNWFAQALPGHETKPIVIRPAADVSTDQQGLTQVFVHAPEGGTFVFEVRSQSSNKNLLLGPITFLPPV